MDLADLRAQLTQKGDDFSWLRRRRNVEVCPTSLISLESDKACSEPVEVVLRGRKFSRCFHVSSTGAVPNGQAPMYGSPSASLWKNPGACCPAIASTFRMKTCWLLEDGSDISFCATGFRLSDTMAVSAGHTLTLDNGQNGNIKQVRGCNGLFVSSDMFEDVGRVSFSLKGVGIPQEWSHHPRDVHGLHTTGSDVCFLMANANCRDSFLLPCSPAFCGDGSDIVVLSYPDVDQFMQRAEEDLVTRCDDDSNTWRVYKPAMASELESAVKELALTVDLKEVDVINSPLLMKQVESKVKAALWSHLQGTFSRFTTGPALCSVGRLKFKGGNASCIATSASTLPGSSGAAICPLEHPGHVVGIHSGGSAGFDQNIGTSTDNVAFVNGYAANVLSSLPHPTSKYWKSVSFSLAPFLDWIQRHENVIGSSPWVSYAKKGKLSRFASQACQCFYGSTC